MTPAQRYAHHFRSWYVRKRGGYLTAPLPASAPRRPSKATERPEPMFATTYFERAAERAYGRLRNGGRA